MQLQHALHSCPLTMTVYRLNEDKREPQETGFHALCLANQCKMRQLKFHEKKLLKKVDFLKWKSEDNLRELQVRNKRRMLSGSVLWWGATSGF